MYRIFVFVLISTLLSEHVNGKTGDQKPTTIPLDQIWGYNMPGTRNVSALDAAKELTGVKAHPIVRQIVSSLASRHPKEGENVESAFIVPGSGRKALENANAVLTNAVEPAKAFSPDTDLTLVFYSAIGGGYVRIASVEKSNHTITVKYRFKSHNTRDDSLHFALIPLGQLPEDRYKVKIEQIGSIDAKGKPSEPIARFERVVCRDTSFVIR